MPLYEYECDECGHRFEVIQKFSDDPIDKCPKCGAKVHKLMSSPAIQFKGSGWYITDYAKKDSAAAGKTGASKDEAASKDDSGSKSSESSETKAASPAPAPATGKTD
jgi:putative FmdB family regulatory protein